MDFQKMIEEIIRSYKVPLQSFTEPKEVDCYIAPKEKSCFTCKYGRVKSDGLGGVAAYCKHPQNTHETYYKYAAECRGNSVNRYTHWEPDCDMEDCDMEETNQAVKADSGKPQLTLVPRQILFDIAEIRAFGIKKYNDPDNWKKVEIQRYRDAAFRHFMAYLDDPQGNDKESGLSHLAHLACNIAFLCELEKKKENETDETADN